MSTHQYQKERIMLAGILIATVASFVASAVLYGVPAISRVITHSSHPRPGVPRILQMASVALRSLIASALVAGLLTAGDWHGPAAGALLGISLSVLPAILLFGAIIHENTPIPVATIHLTDWILKLTIIGAVIGLFL
ncbi:MAG TPA: DUF1761 domain-containing protein [Leifsonia sp.]|jgi:hypothetical protein|nr:DUF1761 domain-containing protein [Leifsonia sp.]